MSYDIQRYLNVRQAYLPSFTADDAALVFLANITDVPQVWRVGVEDRKPDWPEQLSFGADRVLWAAASRAAGDGRILYGRDSGGNENLQLFLLDPASGEERALTAGWDRAMHVPGEWEAGGGRLLFAANRRDASLFDLYVQELDGAARLVWENDAPGQLSSQRFSPDGRRAVVVRNASNARHDLFVVDLDSGSSRQVWQGDAARFAYAAWEADGRTLLVVTDAGSDWLYLARLDADSGALTPLLQLEWDIDVAVLSPDGQRVAVVVNAGGESRPYVYRLDGTGEPEAAPVPVRPGVAANLDGKLAWSNDSRRLAFSYTAATRSADIWIWELDSGETWAATRSSHGGLPVASFVAPELIAFPSFDGREIPAWLFKPSNAGEPLPAVVVVHGGPESQFVAGFNFLVQYLVHRGYAVLAPNVRGSTGYGKAYARLDNVRKRMDSVADLAHAAYWLRERPEIDGDRIAVYGGSYGGFMVLAALTTYPELWAAGVDLVGISNWVTFLQNTSSYRRAHREAEYGSLQHDREFLESISPLTHVASIRAPLMVLHGANDPRVPLGEAQQLADSLSARDVPVELMVFDDEGHGIVKLRNKLAAYPAIARFLDEHVGGR